MTADKGTPKYARVAAAVRGQIADGTLRPGQPAPSGAALSRITGYSTLTCRRALRVLLADGVLTPGPSRNARPRVAGPPQPPAERDLAVAARALATGLAARRRAKGLTQPELAERVGMSVTTVGHAETGRLWQSREFWERADAVLGAGGDLLRLHDAYREACASGAAGASDAAGTAGAGDAGRRRPGDPRGTLPPQARWAGAHFGPAGGRKAGQRDQGGGAAEEEAAAPAGSLPAPPGAAAPGQAMPACVMIVWGDGTVTTVHPPEAHTTETSLTDVPLTGTPPGGAAGRDGPGRGPVSRPPA
jgi:hypothetical protein